MASWGLSNHFTIDAESSIIHIGRGVREGGGGGGGGPTSFQIRPHLQGSLRPLSPPSTRETKRTIEKRGTNCSLSPSIQPFYVCTFITPQICQHVWSARATNATRMRLYVGKHIYLNQKLLLKSMYPCIITTAHEIGTYCVCVCVY